MRAIRPTVPALCVFNNKRDYYKALKQVITPKLISWQVKDSYKCKEKRGREGGGGIFYLQNEKGEEKKQLDVKCLEM